MEDRFSFLEENIEDFCKIVISAPRKKGDSLPSKVTADRVEKDGAVRYLLSLQVGNKAVHKTLSPELLRETLKEEWERGDFHQINLFSEGTEISYRLSKKGKVAKSVNRKAQIKPRTGHDREKQYLLREGDPVPVMVELGIFTKEGKIVRSMYDKFRQINRFLELMDHAFRDYEKDHVRVLDFGCGKSYLTFLVYYYFSVLKKKHVSIIGYDLKADVVEHCNALARAYGYHGLQFVVADVTKDPLSQEEIDFVISLHACDVATDFALHFALEKGVPYIFSVPCCQHEVGGAIRQGQGDLDLLLEHGLFKERLSALLTDAFRTKILEAEGYQVDVVEFVDFAHSPKNVMLRAQKKKNAKRRSLDSLLAMEERYGFRQTLLHLRKEHHE